MEENRKEENVDFLEGIREEFEAPTEEEFTKAIEKLNDTDRDIFENTGVIHVDRNMPAETQTMHVIDLHKQHEKKRNFVFKVIEIMLVLGVITSGIGLVLNRWFNKQERKEEEVVGVSQDADRVPINATSFPDPILRSYITDNIDLNKDGYLSADERNAVLVLLVPQDHGITDVKGISLFPLLESLRISSTGISSLNLTANDKLKYIDISDTSIEELDLSNNPLLESIHADRTQLNNIVFPSVSRIKEISLEDSPIACKMNEENIYESCSDK